MILREDLVEVGKVGKPHGIKGELSCWFSNDAFDIEEIGFVVLCIDGIFVPFFAETIRAKNNSTALIKLDGIDDDKGVKFLVNHTIYAQKASFKPAQIDVDADSDELPLDFFIGFTINTTDGTSIGEITDVDCATENYLFIVNKNVFVPATDDFITDIDFENKILEMDLPEGIFDL
jgi:16S rRNA processing protein RimM